MAKKTNPNTIASNKKAFHNYLISEKIEAGIVLEGCEVKSIRSRHVSLQESYIRFKNNELWLVGCHIQTYFPGRQYSPEPVKDRKLLLHKTELVKLQNKVTEKGFFLIPLSMYFSKNRAKLSVGLGKPKKLFDKRKTLKERALNRDLERRFK